jgi:capsular exopolysaccharide synthesis family protein
MIYREYLRSLRRGWWLVLLGMLLGAGGAGAIAVASTPQYQAATQLFVSTPGASDVAAAVQGSQFSQQRVASYAQLLEGRDMAKAIIDQLGLDLSADDLMANIEAAAVPDTVLLEVTVTDTSPERALAIARSVASEFRTRVTALETPDGATTSPVKVTVVSTPELPVEPSSPDVPQQLLLGAIVGLLCGGGLAVARARLDTRIRDDDAAADAVDAPVIGSLLSDPNLGRTHIVRANDMSPAAEALRHIRANLQFLRVDAPPRVLMVASALANEGKTTLAVNLALSLAESGRTVALVEADLRRPRAADYLRVVAGAGLTNVLNASARLDEVLQPWGDGLTVLAAGPIPPNPSELLASEAMAGVLASLQERFDVVLIDGPPLLPVADAVGLAPLTDGVLLCVRHGRTRAEHLHLAREMLDRVGAPTLGAVMTMAPARGAGATSYAYGYADHPNGRQPARGLFLRRRANLQESPTLPGAALPRPSALRPRRAARAGTGAGRNEFGG